MTREEKKVILASSLGTVFEWYDFYLYGSLAAIIGAQFFSAYPPATRDIFALLAFAAGFVVPLTDSMSLSSASICGSSSSSGRRPPTVSCRF